jgi:hypothetical protein
MRTQAVVVAVLCVAVAGGIFQLAPIGGLVDGAGSGIQSDEVSDQANDSAIGSGDFNGSAETEDEGSLIGTIIAGGRFILDLASMIALIPNTLLSLGLPWWFAQPVGWIATLIGSVGFVQFVTGRRYD